MNQAIAKSFNIRTSARKLRLVADLVRGQNAYSALSTLTHLNQHAAKPVLLTLKQALANAAHNYQLAKDGLFISEIQINDGPIMKRGRAVSRGIRHMINKRTSHILITLSKSDKEASGTKS
jgi:large subunit ribosomal protein L22